MLLASAENCKSGSGNCNPNFDHSAFEASGMTCLSYVCVHCGKPCAALYRKLSASSIKATTCTKEDCQQVVDPYIEREWLLVAIDWILLRPEAYRHVLFNAKMEFPMFESVTCSRALQLVAAFSILHAYLRFESDFRPADTTNASTTDVWMPNSTMIILILASISDVLIQWGTVFFYVNLAKRRQVQAPINPIAADISDIATTSNVATKLFWCYLLPMSFHVTSIFVLIWENSKTTRALGSLLVAGWQSLAVSLVADQVAPTKGKPAAVVGLAAGILWHLLLTELLVALPCVGFEMDFFYHVPRDSKLLPPLCLT